MIRFLSYLTALFAFALLSACGGGGGSSGSTSTSTSFFTTAPSGLTLGVGSSQQFDIGGGRAPYSAVSSNSAVVAAAIANGKLTLGGVAPGSATVSLRDAAGTVQSVGVTVAPAQALATTAPPSGLVVQVGSAGAQTYAISGGVGPYTATSSNPNVLTATVNGNTLTLTGLTAGSATAVLRDSVNTTVSIPVTVSAAAGAALFTTAPATLTVSRGTTTVYSIGGGLAPYTATSSNAAVVSATVSGSQLTISGLANGSGSVVLRDAANNTVTVGVTVSSAPITLNPSSFNAFVGDTLYSVVSGGTAPYTAISAFPDVAEVTIGTLTGGVFTADASGTVLRVKVKQAAGSAGIIVSDANGSSANLTIASSAATNAINLAPKTLTISSCYSGNVSLILYGASGTTNVFASDTTLVTVATPQVTGSSAGTAVTLTLAKKTLAADATVTITAIDANAAVGTSTITLAKSNTACP